uniref:Nuclear receptor-binding factor 2 MIT domain-containing protein n=1 Tax=Glossina brevipalpis TaxID=37001 RepID=A0A1A9W7P2_9MUSC
MDCAPLNLAHFHERRAEKLLKRHDFDEAYKAIETSLYYLQDAYKNARISKSLEVLNTQKWDYERKLHQISMRKQQYERIKVKDIVPSPIENNLSGKSAEVIINEDDMPSLAPLELPSFDYSGFLTPSLVDKLYKRPDKVYKSSQNLISWMVFTTIAFFVESANT